MDSAIAHAEREAAESAKLAARATANYRAWSEGEKAVISSLKRIGEVIESNDFRAVNAGFVEQHKDQFEFSDENRLEWTAIHEQYIELMESTIVKLASDVNMDELITELPNFLQGAAKEQDPAGTGEVIDFLLSLTDFAAFKSMMLSAKMGDASGPIAAVEGAGAGTISVLESELSMPPAILERARVLLPLVADTGDAVEWKTIAKKKGEFELQTVHVNGVKYMRNSVNVNLPFEDCMTCFFDFAHPNLEKWDNTWTDIKVVKDVKDGSMHDQLVQSGFRMPGVVRMVANVPKTFPLRLVTQRDKPAQGSAIIVMTSWDMANDIPDTKSRMSMVRVARVEPSGPDSTRMFNVAQMPDMMPDWVMNLFMSNTILAGVKTTARVFGQQKANGIV